MTGSSPVLRPARVEDLDALMGLENRFPGDRLARGSFRYLITRGHADVLVCTRDGVVVGDAVVLYRRRTAAARLYSLVVDPDRRRQGLGQALLAGAEAAACARGRHSLSLEVRHDNQAALGLYLRAGYILIGSVPDYYEDHESAHRMRKRLRVSPHRPPAEAPPVLTGALAPPG